MLGQKRLLFSSANTIRDGGSTALNTAYIVDTVDTVYSVHTIKLLYTVQAVACMPIYIVREG